MDSHGSHGWVRDAFHGDFRTLKKEMLKDLAFFKDLEHRDLPHHEVPHFSLKLAFHENESVVFLGGPCHSI